jgi:hypothetical protein
LQRKRVRERDELAPTRALVGELAQRPRVGRTPPTRGPARSGRGPCSSVRSASRSYWRVEDVDHLDLPRLHGHRVSGGSSGFWKRRARRSEKPLGGIRRKKSRSRSIVPMSECLLPLQDGDRAVPTPGLSLRGCAFAAAAPRAVRGPAKFRCAAWCSWRTGSSPRSRPAAPAASRRTAAGPAFATPRGRAPSPA